MKDHELTQEQYIENCYKCMKQGWLPIGEAMSMKFQAPSGSIHDLSASNLDMLDYIEKNKINLTEVK